MTKRKIGKQEATAPKKNGEKVCKAHFIYYKKQV